MNLPPDSGKRRFMKTCKARSTRVADFPTPRTTRGGHTKEASLAVRSRTSGKYDARRSKQLSRTSRSGALQKDKLAVVMLMISVTGLSHIGHVRVSIEPVAFISLTSLTRFYTNTGLATSRFLWSLVTITVCIEGRHAIHWITSNEITSGKTDKYIACLRHSRATTGERTFDCPTVRSPSVNYPALQPNKSECIQDVRLGHD